MYVQNERSQSERATHHMTFCKRQNYGANKKTSGYGVEEMEGQMSRNRRFSGALKYS